MIKTGAKPIVLLILITALLLPTLNTGCTHKPPDERMSETRFLMDTYVTLTVHGNVDPGIFEEAFKLCIEYENLLSMTIENSDIWRINHAGGEAVRVDPRTIEIIEAGLKFSEVSGGMFDITVGRLTELWDFGGKQHVPSSEESEQVLTTIDFRQVIIEGDNVRLINPEARIDLGAIAKGYIAYKTAEFLAASGVSGALVDMGGDIVAVGSRPGGDPWRIALRKPFGEDGEYLGVIEVMWVSVLASGIYERRFEKDGVIYHHILDPTTGYPVISDVINAVVIAETAVLGEGLSTIAVLIGSDEAQRIFHEFHGFIGAVLVLNDGTVLEIGNVDLINN